MALTQNRHASYTTEERNRDNFQKRARYHTHMPFTSVPVDVSRLKGGSNYAKEGSSNVAQTPRIKNKEDN